MSTTPFRTCVIVVAMHRSGSSALTFVLKSLGVSLGDNLLDATDSNPKGHWEASDVVAANVRMFKSLDLSWDSVEKFPNGWFSSAGAADLEAFVAATLENNFSKKFLFGFKDPRLCRTLPVWLSRLKRHNARPLCVHITRNPLEVAASLNKRDGIPVARGLMLWLRYVTEGELYSRSSDRTFVTYEDLLSDWQSVADKVASTANIVWPRNQLRARAEIEEFLESDLRHHVSSDDKLLRRTDVPHLVKVAFGALRELAADPRDASAMEALDGVRRDLDNADANFNALVAGLEGEVRNAKQAGASAAMRHKEQFAQVGEGVARLAQTVGILIGSPEADVRTVGTESDADTTPHDKNPEPTAILRMLDKMENEVGEFARIRAGETGAAILDLLRDVSGILPSDVAEEILRRNESVPVPELLATLRKGMSHLTNEIAGVQELRQNVQELEQRLASAEQERQASLVYLDELGNLLKTEQQRAAAAVSAAASATAERQNLEERLLRAKAELEQRLASAEQERQASLANLDELGNLLKTEQERAAAAVSAAESAATERQNLEGQLLRAKAELEQRLASAEQERQASLANLDELGNLLKTEQERAATAVSAAESAAAERQNLEERLLRAKAELERRDELYIEAEAALTESVRRLESERASLVTALARGSEISERAKKQATAHISRMRKKARDSSAAHREEIADLERKSQEIARAARERMVRVATAVSEADESRNRLRERALARLSDAMAERTTIVDMARHLTRATSEARRSTVAAVVGAAAAYRNSVIPVPVPSQTIDLGVMRVEAESYPRKPGFMRAIGSGIYGRRNKATVARLFDREYYKSQLDEQVPLDEDLLAHYLRSGWRRGLNPHPLFSVRYYLETYADIASNDLEPFSHFLRHGDREGRNPHPLFLNGYYRALRGGKLDTSVSVIEDFLASGTEGVDPHPILDLAMVASACDMPGASASEALIHYLNQGWRDGVDPSPLFSADYYRSQLGEAGTAGIEPFEHFVLYGAPNGVSPHPLFDMTHYRAQLGGRDLRHVDPLAHYLTLGEAEGLTPHPLFDPAICRKTMLPGENLSRGLLWHYLSEVVPVLARVFDDAHYRRQVGSTVPANISPLWHYVTEGWRHGVDPHPLFAVRYYLETYADIASNDLEPFSHFLRHGDREGRNPHPLFLNGYYRALRGGKLDTSVSVIEDFLASGTEGVDPHPILDLAMVASACDMPGASASEALIHYLNQGWRDGVDPSPLFSADYYRSQLGEAGTAGIEPFEHFVLYGAPNGVSPHPLFDMTHYRAQLGGRDLRHVDPLAHYLTLGEAEGLTPHPLFDPGFYSQRIPAAEVTSRGRLWHYVTGGSRNMRRTHWLFDGNYFAKRSGVTIPPGETPLGHYVRHQLFDDPSPIFDVTHYLIKVGDRLNGQHPALHFLSTDPKDFVSPHPLFDGEFYRAQRGVAGVTHPNLLIDYLEAVPAISSASPGPYFDSAYYLKRYVDISGGGVNPLPLPGTWR
ncbi:hypothetical protein [Mesorhizobium sp. J428]|uniref:hypothetical protein n=1 Tax=Mesorhizobium sp. J428 TaxID=2898440 RepID=UPI002151E09D|nr:hypothetical protein [Mesorhizobium sp. J428]MCR5858298.1 hypothetical protein [Mesorhizobium sp. J428]